MTKFVIGKLGLLLVFTFSAMSAFSNSLNPAIEDKVEVAAPQAKQEEVQTQDGIPEIKENSVSPQVNREPKLDRGIEIRHPQNSKLDESEIQKELGEIPLPLEKTVEINDKVGVSDKSDKSYETERDETKALPSDGQNLSVDELLASLTPTERKPGEKLSIPKDAKDLSFLVGRWECDMGSLRNNDGDRIKNIFSFNKQGNGTSYVIEENGTVFKATIKAQLANGNLTINTSKFLGTGGGSKYYCSYFYRCRQAESFATCSGASNDPDCAGLKDGRFKDVKFLRIKG